MNTLFYRYGSICEPDIIDALMEYGINVIEETVEVNNKNITASQKADIVSKRLFEREYAFVFSVNYFPEISSVCNIFKIPYISNGYDTIKWYSTDDSIAFALAVRFAGTYLRINGFFALHVRREACVNYSSKHKITPCT